MTRFLIICAVGGVAALALTVLALRRQARPRLLRSVNSISTEDLREFVDAFDAARRVTDVDVMHSMCDVTDPCSLECAGASWWVIGALSDARRRAAEPEVLVAPAIWHTLTAEWPTIHARLHPADVGPHGGTEAEEILNRHILHGGDGWPVAAHAHQDASALTYDGRFAEAVSA